MIAPVNPIEALDQAARRRLAPMWKAAGRPESMAYPVETSEVLSMLQACDYRVSVDFVVHLIGESVVLVPVVAGRAKWEALHVLQLVAELEQRRRWSWPSRIHGWKFTQLERLQAEAEAAGRPVCFPDLERFDVESLLALQVDAEQPAARAALRTVILSKLKAHAAQA